LGLGALLCRKKQWDNDYKKQDAKRRGAIILKIIHAIPICFYRYFYTHIYWRNRDEAKQGNFSVNVSKRCARMYDFLFVQGHPNCDNCLEMEKHRRFFDLKVKGTRGQFLVLTWSFVPTTGGIYERAQTNIH